MRINIRHLLSAIENEKLFVNISHFYTIARASHFLFIYLFSSIYNDVIDYIPSYLVLDPCLSKAKTMVPDVY